jgi:hypothetical protein
MQSAFAKLGRAKVHRDVLDADVEAYRDREPHDFTYKTLDHLFDESQALLTYRLRMKEEPPSDWCSSWATSSPTCVPRSTMRSSGTLTDAWCLRRAKRKS